MCRLLYYSGPPIRLGSLITEPSNSLIHQSVRSREQVETLNGDGFGVAWYAPDSSEAPAVFHSITPAWNDANLRNLAPVVRSPCILAHVRAAPPDSDVSQANCHPFRHGPFAFMHNGSVGSFPRLRRHALAGLTDASFERIRGTTDTEVMFGMFLDLLDDGGAPRSAEDLAQALEATIHEVDALVDRHAPGSVSHLNLVVTDGRQAAASRYTSGDPGRAQSLYLHRGCRYVCENHCACLLPAREGEEAVLVSSEPLNDDPAWQTVPANHLVLVNPDRTVMLRPVSEARAVHLKTRHGTPP